MITNKEQLLYIHYIIDTLLYKEAGKLAGQINGKISSSQLSKLQQLTDSQLWTGKRVDISLQIKDYVQHQKNKRTKNETEKFFLLRFIVF
ncbi:MAG: hypothetical protein JXB88_11400 [Spirochaetales bacterium]|nr:hypothetical protein [Spirochaetales bacterium]